MSAASSARWPSLPVLISPLERDLVGAATGTIDTGERLSAGELVIRPLHTPGHTRGMLSFLIEHRGSAAVFTGDTLFRDSVGGVRAPGHTTYQALKDSIMGTLMELDPETEIYPGHADATSVGREWDHNPVHPDLARAGPRGHAVVRRARRSGDAGPARSRLRRRPQGVGALGRRFRRHRSRLAGRFDLPVSRRPDIIEAVRGRAGPGGSR